MTGTLGPDPWIVCCATADWDAPLWTNKQHLMSRLAQRGMPVLYMDSPGHRAPSISRQDVGRMWGRLRAWRPTARPVQGGVMRDSPLLVPLHSHSPVRRINSTLLRRRLQRNRRALGIDRAVLWVYAPSAVHLFDPAWHSGLVYHCVDHLASYPGIDAVSIAEDERLLIQLADVCIASSRPLLERLRSLGARRTEYWPNPADTGAYTAAARRSRPGNTQPVIGFIGAVQEHKVDVELMVDCARALPEYRFELVGPVGIGLSTSHISTMALPPNLLLVGGRPKEQLPAIVAGFDVAVIPYRVNEYTRYVYPMKVFEYLAGGIPVVSTILPSLVGEVDHVDFAATAPEFADAIQRALRNRGPERAEARMAYAAAHSWESRTDAAVALLSSLRMATEAYRPVGATSITSSGPA